METKQHKELHSTRLLVVSGTTASNIHHDIKVLWLR